MGSKSTPLRKSALSSSHLILLTWKRIRVLRKGTQPLRTRTQGTLVPRFDRRCRSLGYLALGRNYLLFMDADAAIADIPISGVRLDDLSISQVIEHFKASILHRNWPVDFDKNGMIRATRVPPLCLRALEKNCFLHVSLKDEVGGMHKVSRTKSPLIHSFSTIIFFSCPRHLPLLNPLQSCRREVYYYKTYQEHGG